MIREAICEGSDVKTALDKAKAELGLEDTADCEFEIIQREEKKKFGLFGGRPAKVRVYVEVPDPVVETPAPVASASVADDNPADERAAQFLRNVLDKMTLESVQMRRDAGRAPVSDKPCCQSRRESLHQGDRQHGQLP